VRPQTRLDVHHRDLCVERGQGAGEGGRGVALDHHRPRLELRQHRLQAREDARGDPGQRLPLPEDVQVDMRVDVEHLEDLVEHLAVLPGGDDQWFEGQERRPAPGRPGRA
jgi:hypothetical protein